MSMSAAEDLMVVHHNSHLIFMGANINTPHFGTHTAFPALWLLTKFTFPIGYSGCIAYEWYGVHLEAYW